MTKESIVNELSKYEMFLQNPSIYVGNCSNDSGEFYSYDFNENQLKLIRTTWSSILLKMFDELLMNCLDNYQSSKKSKTPMSFIDVCYDSESISITNNGKAISLQKNSNTIDGKIIYNPELIFSRLFTSSHYSKKDENIAGMNGIGAKIATVFSKVLHLRIINNHTQYTQTFIPTKNDIQSSIPEIIKGINKENITEIIFEPDLDKIKECSKEIYEGTLQMFIKRLIDVKLIENDLQIFVNGNELKDISIDSIFKLYSLEDIVKFPCGYICKSNSFKQISIINGISVNRGGVHINNIIDSITKYTEQRMKRIGLRSIIKSSIFIIFIGTCPHPSFTSQDKVELYDGFPSKLLSEDVLKKIYNTLDLNGLISGKEREKATKENSITSKRLRIKDLTDATYAGTKKSSECILFLTEGLSALSFAKIGMKTVLDANYYGCYPLGGKILNVRKSKLERTNKSETILNIEKILGLKVGSKNDSLRYGKVVILKDADTDGAEIMGLVINFFHFQYPELLKRDFLYEFITPMIKLSIPKQILSNDEIGLIKGLTKNQFDNIIQRGTYSIIPFFNEQSFKSYKEQYPLIENYKTNYIKGLAGNEDWEVSNYFKHESLNTIKLVSDKDLDESIEIVYGKDSTKRKIWMKDDSDKFLNRSNQINISDFLNNDVLMFSFENCKRCIPSSIDGLKPSQRKVLWTLLNSKHRDVFRKVFMLTGEIASYSYYNHGDMSMNETIIKMGQTFAGSNNLNIVEPSGFFGSREYLGNDHGAPRYIECKLNQKILNVFPLEDIKLLDKNFEDNVQIEPKYFIPIIPMILVNGSCGIGTGYSTFVPMFTVEDIKQLTINWIKTGKLSTICPKVNNFNGSIKLESNGYSIYGNIRKLKQTTTFEEWEITEIPYDIAFSDFDNILKELYNSKKIIDYRYGDKNKNKEGINSINYIVRISIGTLLSNLLPLVSRKSMTNMTLFDSSGMINKYKDIESIFMEWASKRYELYEKRKQYKIESLEYLIKILKNKLRFLEEFGPIIRTMDIEIVEKELDERKYDKIDKSFDYLLNIPIKQLTKNNIIKLTNDINSNEKSLKELVLKEIEEMWLEDIEKI